MVEKYFKCYENMQTFEKLSTSLNDRKIRKEEVYLIDSKEIKNFIKCIEESKIFENKDEENLKNKIDDMKLKAELTKTLSSYKDCEKYLQSKEEYKIIIVNKDFINLMNEKKEKDDKNDKKDDEKNEKKDDNDKKDENINSVSLEKYDQNEKKQFKIFF